MEDHIKKTHEDERREQAKGWALRGVLKWTFIVTAVAAGVAVGIGVLLFV